MVGRASAAPADGVLRTGGPNGPCMGRSVREPVVASGRKGGGRLRRRGALSPTLSRALESPGGKCYRHCEKPIGTRSISSRLPGSWQVRACPSGVVSVTSYAEWTRRDPTPTVRAALRRWTFPASLVRSRDLRIATRRGPELGRAAERELAAAKPRRGVRIVYWRLYPFRARDGTERRLFVCFRRVHASPVFFAASPTGKTWRCPVCAGHRAKPSRR